MDQRSRCHQAINNRPMVSARRNRQRDHDYLVSGDQIVIIDPVSGRPLTSRYADGTHEALEAKEGLAVRPATQVIGSVLCRDYLRQYDRLAGLTGTAASEAPVYRDLYGLEVITIPTNRPVIRVDHPDKLYRTRQAKLAAIASDTGARALSGQPVLVGAMSEADAQAVARLLGEAGISCELLSARNFEREATVLADAGRPGAVTIVVKMAGRGVDIVLGGRSGAEREVVVELGGLCVLGTERNGDRRTELHLRGRAGRRVTRASRCSTRRLRTRSSASSCDTRQRQSCPTACHSNSSHGTWTRFNSAWRPLRLSGTRATPLSTTCSPSSSASSTPNETPYFTSKTYEFASRPSSTMFWQPRSRSQCRPGAIRGLSWPGLCGCIQWQARLTLAARCARGGRDSVPGVLAAVRRDAQQAYANREAQLGGEIMRDFERRALLSATDIAWREHLAAMSDLFSSAMIRGGRWYRVAAGLPAGGGCALRRDDRSDQARGCQRDLLRQDQAAAWGQLGHS
jgi:hypothetical protein